MKHTKQSAGQIGGRATVAKHGRQHMQQIGKEGARVTWERHSMKPINQSQYAMVRRSDGKIRWMNQLQQFENPKAKRGLITYVGPVLAGGRLIVVGSNGMLINLDPTTGSFQSQTSIGAGVSLQPVVANSTLYILDNVGRLHAFR